MFIAGKYLFPHKHVRFAIMQFAGIGATTAIKICSASYVHPFCKVQELTEIQIERMKPLILEVVDAEKKKKIARMKREQFLEAFKPRRLEIKK